jgi:hypothetical protein
MIPEIISQWDENKNKLEERFREDHPSSYESIIKSIFELVVSDFDISKMTVIDDGGYQGTKIFIIPKDTYQPSVSDYVVTHNRYGSCSGCDTLQGTSEFSDDKPTEEQIKEYMTLALHLIQKMKWLSE